MRRDREDGSAPVPPTPKGRRGWFLPLVLLLGAVTIAGGWAYREYWVERPMGEGPAGPTVDRQPFQEIWSAREVMLVGLGDSITSGYGAAKGYSYFDRLASNPIGDSPDMEGLCLGAVLPGLTALNLSKAGSTSIDHVEEQIAGLSPLPRNVFGLVVITTGGNDLIHSYGQEPPRDGAMYGATFEEARPWIEAFAQRLDTLLTRINERFPGGCEIFLANIYDPTDGIGDASPAGLPAWPDSLRILAAYNRIIAAATDHHLNVRVVDLYSTFMGHGLYCRQFWRPYYRESDPTYWYSIVEDPNERGHDAIRRLFLIEFAKARDRIAPVSLPLTPALKADGPL